MQIIALAIFSLVFGVVFVAVYFLFKRRHWTIKVLISFIGTIAIIGLTIYGFSPKKIDYSDPELAPLWKAAQVVDRASMGFTPVLKDSKISIERSSGEKYDVMLHIVNHTSRTIAFRKKGDEFVWIGEQESFEGPKKFDSPDGIFNESITITYDKEKISGAPINVLYILYLGEDPRLITNHNLTLADIRPILKEWKY